MKKSLYYIIECLTKGRIVIGTDFVLFMFGEEYYGEKKDGENVKENW
jgi:hypothetical protein